MPHRLILVFVLVYSSSLQANVTHQVVDASARENLELTVYNNDFTVIRDRRELILPKGDIELEFQDVAMTISPPTVSVSSEDPKGLVVTQQNYRFDLLNRRSLLERFVGQKVKFSRFVLEGTQFEKVLREGILLSIEPEIVQFGDVIEVQPEGTISLPYLPDDLRTTPTLIFRGENNKSGIQTIDVSYHAFLIGWEADYSLKVDDRGRGELSGWITIRNNTGTDFPVTRLRLVAGEVGQVPSAPVPEVARMAMAVDTAGVQPEEFGDYYAYDYPDDVHILKNDMTQLRLIEAEGIRVDKTYRLNSLVTRYQMEPVTEVPLNVVMAFTNNKKNKLGVPVPAGTVRVYENEDDFIGEARINHAPEGEEIELNTGRAFDVKANRVQTSYQRLGERSIQVGYRIEVTNAGRESVPVELHEKFQGDWDIVQESEKGESLDARTRVYTLKVPSKGQTTVEYLAQIKW